MKHVVRDSMGAHTFYCSMKTGYEELYVRGEVIDVVVLRPTRPHIAEGWEWQTYSFIIAFFDSGSHDAPRSSAVQSSHCRYMQVLIDYSSGFSSNVLSRLRDISAVQDSMLYSFDIRPF